MKVKKYKNGETYHSLSIINENAGKTTQGARLVECVCICGSSVTTRATYLGSGHTKSCGCRAGTKVRKHGMHKTKTHYAWRRMIGQCYDKDNRQFDRYGGCGVLVFYKWRVSFEVFLDSVGEAADGNTMLLRIDVNKNFEPGNVYWGSGLERNLGRRKWEGTSSKYKGVYWIKAKQKWRSEIRVADRKIHLGYFESEIDAYKAFCDAHLEYRGTPVQHGEFIKQDKKP